MPSNACIAFHENADDIDRLLEIHKEIGGEGKGRRFRFEVFNKSAILLITSFWEVYCEDVAAEAVKRIVKICKSPDRLPEDLRKRMTKELKASKHELAGWELADRGWRDALLSRLTLHATERNYNMNTPNAGNIVDMFETDLGLKDVSVGWTWQGMRAKEAKDKLDRYVKLRHVIAHRGKARRSCKKKHVVDYFSHVKNLVDKTDITVNYHVKKITGHRLWK